MFFSFFSEVFSGKRLRTVWRAQRGVPQATENTKKKALRKTALRWRAYPCKRLTGN